MGDTLQLFTQKTEEQTFYRPLSREIYNFIMYKSFGLNPLSFHIVNLLLILFNSIVLFFIIKVCSKNISLAIFVIVIYLFSSVHNIELYYLASVQTLMATAFALLSALFFIKSIGKFYLYLTSILFFLAALLCHESVIILPGIIFLSSFIIQKKIISSLPFVALALSFFVIMIFLSGLPSQKVYQPVIEPKSIASTLSWYVLWSFGLPEMLVDFVKPNLVLKEEFIIWYGSYAKVVFPLFALIILILFVTTFYLRKIFFKNYFLLFFLGSFLVSLLPFLFFPQHKYIYYLSLPTIFFSGSFGFILYISWKSRYFFRVLASIALLSFIVISYYTNDLNSITHWAAKRAKAARYLVQQFRLEYPMPPKGSVFYILDDPSYPNIAKQWGTSSKQAFYILSGSNALRLLYNDNSIKVYYQAVESPPKDLSSNNIIRVTAKFPY